MNSTSKGDSLEDAFHQYLLDQQDHGELVFGAYPPENCKIFRKKEYYCREREANVEFDIALELYRTGRDTPHLYVIFECKNHDASISEIYVNDFSSKIGRIFPHAVKGIIVVTSRLQSGAEKVARNARMGIVKYDEHGLEIIADRRGACVEHGFVRSQIFRSDNPTKSLKFSAYHDGNYFGTIDDLLTNLDPELTSHVRHQNESGSLSVPFLSIEQIKDSAARVLELANYEAGAVDLSKICRSLSIDLQFADQAIFDADGVSILGSANFGRKTIQINSHTHETRERFTIGHEIGHFCLDHERYLRSETIIERDLFITRDQGNSFNYERLEYQANAFSAELILPDAAFLRKTAHFRRDLDMRDRGHGYIFVDDQPCNYVLYEELLSRLSTYFEVSKQAIEVKFKKAKLLTDKRRRNEASPMSRVISDLTSSRRS
ncbi:ImmA/IrrE family metallo-endopeptidase [Neorhizobium sp. LjRoot104]|uniref:ImmA/IrrE family metallo-endopeptidase n=1 Tax=Neorhizobium sp. LjRoot104 TaxID=3342254 RepID=UPI003ED0E34A